MADLTQDAMPNSTPSPQPPPALPEGTIHIKVRTPHGSLAASVSASTFSLGAVPVTSTIGALRHNIQQTLPTNPAPPRQRLLYAGRSLYDDAETVQDALNIRRSPEQREYVIHLVVRGEAGAGETTESPIPQGSQITSGAQQVHQNAMQQHQQLHQRLHQQHVAQAQQAPLSPFTWAGMQGAGMPTQGPMGMGLAQQQQQHGVGFDPATFQRLQMQQAHLNQGRPAAPQTPQPNGTNDGNASSTEPAAIPLPPSGPTSRNAQSPQPQGDAQTQPQSQPQQPGTPIQPQHPTQPGQHQHQHHHMNGNFRAELHGPNGERWEFQQQTFNLPHPQHPGHGSAYVMSNHGPAAQPQQGQGMQAHAARPFAAPPHFGPPGWAPGMPAIPGIPQINIPHIQMPQIGVPMQAQWPPQQWNQQRMTPTNPNTAGARTPTGPSALDRARSNMAEMRRMLDDLRNPAQNPGAPETVDVQSDTSRLIGQIEQRMRDVEGYIDPLGLGAGINARNAGDANTTTARSTNPAGTGAPRVNPATLLSQRLRPEPDAFWSALASPQQQTNPTNPQDVTAYLLSSPNGPQAILYSPQHGTYTSTIQPTPTRTTQQPTQQTQQPGEAQPDPAAREAAHRFIQDVAAQRLAGAQAIAAGRDPALQEPLAPLQPFMAHFWLLLRILIFSYFLLGSDMSYAKMLMLAGIGFAFWAFRLGILGNEEIMNQARRWWAGVVGLPERPREQAAGQNGQQPPQLEQRQDQAAVAGQAGAAQPAEAQQQRAQQRMPTPEEVAQRLINENGDQNRGWLREQIRPVERAVALFVASLWPGIGEAHVRAQRELREQEERRAAEAEVEARRRAEGERGAQEKKDGESSTRDVQTENAGESSEKEQTSLGGSSAVEGGEAAARE